MPGNNEIVVRLPNPQHRFASLSFTPLEQRFVTGEILGRISEAQIEISHNFWLILRSICCPLNIDGTKQ
jgi:hypothetical protein